MITVPAIILLSVFNTVEFYVIVSVISAAAIAAISLPERKREVKSYVIPGELLQADSDTTPCGPGNGELIFECHAGNVVSLHRKGLQGVVMDGAISIVVNVSGFDISIEEIISQGASSSHNEASSAVFTLGFLAPEWYHIHYESERHCEHASTSLHVREGIIVSKKLIH